jgi:uncharacterized membrane protein
MLVQHTAAALTAVSLLFSQTAAIIYLNVFSYKIAGPLALYLYTAVTSYILLSVHSCASTLSSQRLSYSALLAIVLVQTLHNAADLHLKNTKIN